MSQKECCLTSCSGGFQSERCERYCRWVIALSWKTWSKQLKSISSLETQTHPRWSPDWSLSVPPLKIWYRYGFEVSWRDQLHHSWIVDDVFIQNDPKVIACIHPIIPSFQAGWQIHIQSHIGLFGLLIFAPGALSPKESGLERSCTPWPKWIPPEQWPKPSHLHHHIGIIISHERKWIFMISLRHQWHQFLQLQWYWNDYRLSGWSLHG